MMEHCMDNLSIIHENMEEGLQALEEVEGLKEMLGFLGLFQNEYIASDDLHEVIVEYAREGTENSLTGKLKSIKKYAQKSKGGEVGEFLVRKYKNLVRCVLFHQTTLLEDYYLLFDILLATCRPSSNHSYFLHQLQTATSKLQDSDSRTLAHHYLQIIYILVSIKLAAFEDRFAQLARLKELCMKSMLIVISEFAVKIIVKKNVGGMKDFEFLREILGQARYDRIVSVKRLERIKEQNPLYEYIIHKQIASLHQFPKQQESTKSGSQTRQQSDFGPQMKQESIPMPSLLPWEKLEETIKGLQSRQNTGKSVCDIIKSVSIKDIKQMADGKNLLRRLLHLSFEHSELMADTIQKALYLFQIQEFIDEMKHLFEANRGSKLAQAAIKIVKKQLKNYCGKDASYFWSKIYSQGK